MTTPLELEDLLGLSVVGDVQLSPDGGSVAFTVSEIDAERDDYRTTIWLAPTGAGEPRRYSHGPAHDTAPRWSPDGRRLAFLSDRDGGQPQLYLLPTGGEARRLTDLEHGAGAAVWAPDREPHAVLGAGAQRAAGRPSAQGHHPGPVQDGQPGLHLRACATSCFR